jgi:integrase
MAKTLNKLSPMTIKSMVARSKKEGKTEKAPDGGGLYFVAEHNRSAWWRFDYRINGKQKTLSVGLYPEIGIQDARARRDELRKQLANGIDPGLQRRAERIAQSGADCFEAIAREWWEHKKDAWTEGHADRTLTRLVNDVFPYLGAIPINNITALMLLEIVRRIEARGAIETAHRTNQTCEAVFAYAIGTARCEYNPATAIRAVLKPVPRQKNFARLKDQGDISNLLCTIDEYKGSHIVRSALKLLSLTFVRPGELAQVEWRDISFNGMMWTIPAHVKKQRADRKQDPERVHLVPLSRQASDILKDLHHLTGLGRYVFPSLRTAPGSKSERHMAPESMLGALRRMGFDKSEMTSHGFRGIASTKLREAGKGKFSRDVIEAQLAHTITNKTEQAYNHAEYVQERITMMQWWADYLDGLREGTVIVPFKKPN